MSRRSKRQQMITSVEVLFKQIYRNAQRRDNIVHYKGRIIVFGYNPKLLNILTTNGCTTAFKYRYRKRKKQTRYFIVFGDERCLSEKNVECVTWHEIGHIINGDLDDDKYNDQLNFTRISQKPSKNNIATLSEINADLVSVEYCGLNHVIRWLDHEFECLYRGMYQSDTYNDLDRIGADELYLRIIVLLKRCKKVNRRFKAWKSTTMLKNDGSTI